MHSPKKILVAEDEKAIYRPLVLKLQKEGYDVVVAENGDEALEKVQSEHFDLLLLDLVMPKRSGFSVLEEMQKLNKTIPVIVLSNLSQNEDRDKISALGVKTFLDKSNISLLEVVTLVKRYLKS
jgi:DNA-binding response OmpR family regulator